MLSVGRCSALYALYIAVAQLLAGRLKEPHWGLRTLGEANAKRKGKWRKSRAEQRRAEQRGGDSQLRVEEGRGRRGNLALHSQLTILGSIGLLSVLRRL